MCIWWRCLFPSALDLSSIFFQFLSSKGGRNTNIQQSEHRPQALPPLKWIPGHNATDSLNVYLKPTLFNSIKTQTSKRLTFWSKNLGTTRFWMGWIALPWWILTPKTLRVSWMWTKRRKIFRAKKERQKISDRRLAPRFLSATISSTRISCSFLHEVRWRIRKPAESTTEISPTTTLTRKTSAWLTTRRNQRVCAWRS